MATKNVVTGDQYYEIDGKMLEIKRQLRQKGGYPHDVEKLSRALQAISEGDFGMLGAIRTLADMLATGKYHWVNPNIVEKNFPVNPALFTTEGCKVFHINKAMKTHEVEAAIRSVGYEPDGIEKLLAYGAENPEEQRKYPIVGLGSSWVHPGGSRRVPYLYENDRERDVHLDWDDPQSEWNEHCRFLASPKSSA